MAMLAGTQAEPCPAVVTQTLIGQAVLVIGTEPWFGPLLSKHHVVLELCKHNRVMYLEPAYHAGQLMRGQFPRQRYREHYHNLHPLTLDRLRPWQLPKSHTSALLRRLSQVMLLVQIRAHRFRPDIIISFHPGYAFLAGWWRAPFVYYAVDSQSDLVAEAETLAQADLVVAATEQIYRSFLGRTRRVEYLPHGVSLELMKRDVEHVPIDIATIAHPIAGFAGAVNAHLDLSVIEHLAHALPTWSIVLIGPYERDAFGGGLSDEALRRMRALPNVHLLGAKSADQLGAYINAFDVGIVPYDVEHPRVHFSYHKTLQYMALGKPVATTCAVSDSMTLPHVYTGGSPEGFAAAVERALIAHSAAAADECRAFAGMHTWAECIQRLAAWLSQSAPS